MDNNTVEENIVNENIVELNKKIDSTIVIQNIYSNNEKMMNELRFCKTPDELRLYNLMLVKNYVYNNKIFGLLHVQVKYFKKSSNYDNYIKIIQDKLNEAMEISKTNTNIGGIFVLLDLSNITQKNFSRKFMKIISKILNEKYDKTLLLCYVMGNIRIMKVFWPIIKLVMEKETKEKLVLLN